MKERKTTVTTVDGTRHRFDYRGMHRYLITMPVFSSKHIFTDAEIVIRVLTLLRKACREHQFDVYAYCFLPDQMVMIARGKSNHSHMKEFLSSFRASTSEALKPTLNHPLWSHRYLERVLRKAERNRDVASQIFRLPVKAQLAARPEDYSLQGSFVFSFPPK